jgi:hypothetical protein
MAELSDWHEVKTRGRGRTIAFSADSEDGRLVISQVPDERREELCTVTLADHGAIRSARPFVRPNRSI